MNEKERLVIDIMLEAYDKEISERAVCRIRGVDQGTFAYRKKKVLNKIRNILLILLSFVSTEATAE